MIPSFVEDDVCPVPDEMLGRLYSSHAEGLDVLVRSVGQQTRARLALYCYRRAHLHDLGLAIAATCDRESLVEIGARVGEAVYLRSREEHEQVRPATHGKRAVSLATAATMSRLLRWSEDEEPGSADAEETH